MIQRKQTLFLLFAVIACAFCMFLPVGSIQPQAWAPTPWSTIWRSGRWGNQDFLYLPAIVPAAECGGSAVVGNDIPFQESQVADVALLSGSALQCLVVCRLCPDVLGHHHTRGGGQDELGVRSLPALVSLILIWMAKKGVEHDEKLVKAADRIR